MFRLKGFTNWNDAYIVNGYPIASIIFMHTYQSIYSQLGIKQLLENINIEETLKKEKYDSIISTFRLKSHRFYASST